MHGSGWGDFLTQPTMVGQKKFNPNPSHKSNPTHMGRVKPVGLTNFIIIIIIKLSKKNININILKKLKD